MQNINMLIIINVIVLKYLIDQNWIDNYFSFNSQALLQWYYLLTEDFKYY